MIELLLFALGGCLLGCFTGLIPGVHVNTVCALALALGIGYGDITLVVLIVAMSVTHSFVDFVPSIALGAPSEGSLLAVLPGHRLLMRGLGMYAIRLTVAGGIVGTVIAVAMLPLFLLFVWKMGGFLYEVMGFVLIAVLMLMVLGELGFRKKFWALVVVALSGCLGVVVLQSGAGAQATLFPLVTGFFGASTLLYSVKQNHRCAEQDLNCRNYTTKGILWGSVLSAVAGSLVALLPGVGPAQAALVVRKFFGRISTSRYMTLLGGINTSNAVYAFVVLFLIGKARTGAAAAVAELLELSAQHILLIIACVIFAAGFGALATEFLAKRVLRWVQGADYRSLGVLIVVLLAVMVAAFSGARGLIAFAAASATGLVAITSGVRRSGCMAFLMVPTVLFYLNF